MLVCHCQLKVHNCLLTRQRGLTNNCNLITEHWNSNQMAQDPWHTFVGQISAVFIILFDLYLSSSFIQVRILLLDSFRAN